MESTLKISISGAVKEENNLTTDEHEEKCATENSKDDKIESAKSQMIHVKEENARLKALLEQIETDYKSLQKRFSNNIAQQESKKSHTTVITNNEDIEEPEELVSLCLGRSPCFPKKEDTTCSTKVKKGDHEDEHLKNGLKLSLDYDYESSKMEVKNDLSPDTSLTETKEDEAGDQRLPPSKVLKTVRSGDDDDELSQNNAKRARVCVRTRCDAPTLNDGCQWRKYGQKIAKGNPCPRAYYRCTVAPSCPVRKQVQRCAEDMTILTTTYEGAHNHPLPMSATAMASTTSAAASMLLSGSKTSHSQPGFSSSINHGGLNLKLPDTSKPQPFCLPNSSPQPPTITLDLTTNQSSSSNHYNMFSSKFPSMNLNFYSPESTMLPSVLWSSGHHSYGAQSFNKTPIGLCYQQYMEKSNQTASQQALAEALTKAMKSEPRIQSVIAAAISSMKYTENVEIINSTPNTFDFTNRKLKATATDSISIFHLE